MIEIPDSSLVAGVSRCLGDLGRALRDRQSCVATTPLPWTATWADNPGMSPEYETVQSLWIYVPDDIPAGYLLALPCRIWYVAGADGSELTSMVRLSVGSSHGTPLCPETWKTDVMLTCPLLASQRGAELEASVEVRVPENRGKTLPNRTRAYVGAPSAGCEYLLSIRRP